MDLPQLERRMPGVPVDLKNVELRLPGTFRELCANAKFSNEQIGRIVRCVALGTECFVTPEIELEVFSYRQDQKRRLNAKLRKAKSRRRLGMSGAENPEAVMPDDPMPPTERITKAAAEAAFPCPATLISAPAEPEAPISAPSPTPADKTSPLPAPSLKRRRTKAEKARDDLTGDLFAGICGQMGSPSERMRAAAVPTQDSRNDAAWIPGKFGEFWAQYPRKVAKSDAMKAFTKLIKAQQDVDKFMSTTLASLAYWKTQEQWAKDKGKFIPYPASWLNAGHWKDSEENASNVPVQATFLQGDAESDAELLKRMQGG